MTNSDILGLLGTLVPLLFAGTFFVFWLGQRNAPHILLTSIAFSIFSLSLFLCHYIFDEPDFAMVTSISVLNSAAILVFAQATSIRLKIKAPTTLMLTVASIGLFSVGITSIVMDDIGPRFVILSATFGVLSLIAGLNMLRAKQQTRINFSIVFIVLLAATNAFASPLLAWKFGLFGTVENFKETIYWSVINVSAVLMSIILSMALVVAFANDLVSKIQSLSDLDVLTGVKTRRAFELEARAIFAQHARSSLPISIIVVDLDHFKAINDKHGHLVGDRVLANFGRLMTNALRTTDVIGRMGGEEFCIILWNTAEDGAVFVAEGLRARFENAEISNVPKSKSITASFGVIEVAEREDFASAFERADKSMYFAKQTGRNRVCVGNKILPVPNLAEHNEERYWSETAHTATLN